MKRNLLRGLGIRQIAWLVRIAREKPDRDGPIPAFYFSKIGNPSRSDRFLYPLFRRGFLVDAGRRHGTSFARADYDLIAQAQELALTRIRVLEKLGLI